LLERFENKEESERMRERWEECKGKMGKEVNIDRLGLGFSSTGWK
jgi:hypothetical protein